MDENKNKIILDLCGGTGSWSKPYKDAGYDVRVITLPEHDVLKVHSAATNIVFLGAEGKDLIIPTKKVYGIFAAPPLYNVFIRAHHRKNTQRLQQSNGSSKSLPKYSMVCSSIRKREVLGTGKPTRLPETISGKTSSLISALRVRRQTLKANRHLGIL